MKLRPGIESTGRTPRLKSREVLGVGEPINQGLEFDVTKVVEDNIWERVDRCLRVARVNSTEMPFFRLTVFDLQRRMQAEQFDELPGQIQVEIANIARHEVDPDIAVNTELVKYVDLFPDVLNGLDEPLAPVPHDFDKSLTSFDGYMFIDHDIALLAPRMRALVQLFPDKQAEISRKLDSLEFWDKGMKGARELSQVPGEALNDLPAILANLAVIFPERTGEILEVIRPRWRQLQDRLKARGNLLDMELDDPDPENRPGVKTVTNYVDNVLGMAFLADVSQRKALTQPSKLPDRLVT